MAQSRRSLEDYEEAAVEAAYQASLTEEERYSQAPRSPIQAETIDGVEYVDYGDHEGTFAVMRREGRAWVRIPQEEWPELYRGTGIYDLPPG